MNNETEEAKSVEEDFNEIAERASNERYAQLHKAKVEAVENTFDAQRAKVRWAIKTTFGPQPEEIEDSAIFCDLEIKDGEAKPKFNFHDENYICEGSPNGALLSIITPCPSLGIAVRTPLKSIADLGDVLMEHPHSPEALSAPTKPTLTEIRSRAVSAMKNAAPGDYLAPIAFLQAVSTDVIAQAVEGIDNRLAHMNSQLVDINQAISDFVYKDTDEIGIMPGQEIVLTDDDCEIKIIPRQDFLCVKVYSTHDDLEQREFHFNKYGFQLLQSHDDEVAPQLVFDAVETFNEQANA